MSEKNNIPPEYGIRGWFGNNTTIPPKEKHWIAREDVDLDEQAQARAAYRGQEPIHHFYCENGMAPDNRSHDAWIEYEELPTYNFNNNYWELPICEQRVWRGNGRFSKSQRNMELFQLNQQRKRIVLLINGHYSIPIVNR